MGGKAAKERRRLERLALNWGGNSTKEYDFEPLSKHLPTAKKPDFQTRKGSPNDHGGIKASFQKNGNEFRTIKNGKLPPKGKTQSISKFSKKSDMKVEKKKAFKKPKHLKRKLEQVVGDEKEKVLSDLQMLEERKKLFSLTQPSKKQKKETSRDEKKLETKNTKAPCGTTPSVAPATLIPETINRLKPTIDSIVDKPGKKCVTEPAALIDEPNITSEGDISSKEKAPATLKEQTNDKESSKLMIGKSTEKLADKEPTNKKAAATSAEKTSASDSDSDSDTDDDEIEQNNKRQRGRGRKGRQDTEKYVQETNKENDEKKQRRKPKDMSRRCIGRKALTDFVLGQRYSGKVVYIKPFGAFIDINCHSEAFCHVSRLQDGFVENPESILSVGDEVYARIVEIDRAKKRITVSLQSDKRIADELASIEAHRERTEKRNQKMNRKANANVNVDRVAASDGSQSRKTMQEGNNNEEEVETLVNDLVDAEGNYLKDESEMTPGEVKRARKLARRAQRRIQQQETGIAA